MRRGFYLTHPQVNIDPAIPVPDWGLNSIGAARALQASRSAWMAKVSAIYSSAERKAIETAEPCATARQVPVTIRQAMHENDRSATGYLPPPEFEVMADAFFANPYEQVRGWERAIDAQIRIVGQVWAALAADRSNGDVLFVGHGGVGTLLLCHLLGQPIRRIRDQPGGGGNVFCFDLTSLKVIHPWLALEDERAGQP